MTNIVYLGILGATKLASLNKISSLGTPISAAFGGLMGGLVGGSVRKYTELEKNKQQKLKFEYPRALIGAALGAGSGVLLQKSLPKLLNRYLSRNIRPAIPKAEKLIQKIDILDHLAKNSKTFKSSPLIEAEFVRKPNLIAAVKKLKGMKRHIDQISNEAGNIISPFSGFIGGVAGGIGGGLAYNKLRNPVNNMK